MEAIYKNGELLMHEVRETQIHNDSFSFWNLGQAGILLKGRQEDGLICIDPYLTRSIEKTDPETEFKRAFPPILAPVLLRGINGVIVTHDHDDHLDFSTLKEIASISDDTRFAVPAPLVSKVSE
jgi:L-ascorbate 6-phosphate lactonase